MAFFPPVTDSPRTPRELIPAATHEAYCYGIVDLGTHERKPYMGKEKEPARELLIFFEFPDLTRQFKDDAPEEPMVKSQRYTYFTDEKSNLAKMLMAWQGKKVGDVTFSDLPGQPASITIAHEAGKTDASKIYDNIKAITPLSPKLIPLMKARHNKDMIFSISEDGFESEKFTKLYEWVQNVIKESFEYKEYKQGPPAASAMPFDDEEDLPFK